MAIYTLQAVNEMPISEFVKAFGGVAEHSPWVAEKATRFRPFLTPANMSIAFSESLLTAERGDQLALIRAHPDLAGKAAISGSLTEDSFNEQAGAGLDTLTKNEFELFCDLNEKYKKKFDFPFIFAVKGANKHQILEAFQKRLENNTDQEFQTALDNICRIFSFRIEERIS